MRSATLTRDETSDQGTFGTLVTDSGFTCLTGELPWRDNHPKTSCIPPGAYEVEWGVSPSKGPCYHVRNVPDRSDILIHSANLCGDVDQGFVTQLLGCIAPGLAVGELQGQKAVLSSRPALQKLQEDLGEETFELTIV